MKLSDAKYDLIAVTWDDAEADSGWDEPPKTLEEKLVLTVGFKIKETKNHILIANTIDGTMSNGRLQIPKKMIKSVEVLKEKAP